jgi:hypothetical protein
MNTEEKEEKRIEHYTILFINFNKYTQIAILLHFFFKRCNIQIMSGINLDIQSYSLNDIESLFKLPPNYTGADVELKEFELRTQLLNNTGIDKRYKTDIMNFLETAKNKINMLKFNSYREKQPTTITNNWKLDNVDYPASREVPSRIGEITERPPTQYIYTDTNEFFPGSMNPLNTRITSKVLTIDTKFRENYYLTNSSDFILQLPEKIYKAVSMQLTSVEIPLNFYGISSSYGNNFLYLYVSYGGSNASEIITIPDGNYSPASLIDTINSVIADSSITVLTNIVFSVDLSGGYGSGKVSVSVNGTAGGVIDSLTLDFTKNASGIIDVSTPLSTKLGWALGFKQILYEGKTSYVSESPINPFPMKYIYLGINDYNTNTNNNYVSAFSGGTFNADIIGRISLGNTGFFNVISENDFKIVGEQRKYFGPVDIQKMQIRLYDDQGRILNMNNTDYSFTILLKTLYNL